MSSNIRHDLQMYTRILDPKIQHDTRYNPSNYISIQSKVNNSSDFDDEYMSKLASQGWVSLKKISDIFLYPKGRMFKYRLNGKSLSGAPEGTFRSGGWILGQNENNDENKDDYFLYKAYNGVIFPLQLKDILEIYIKLPNKEISVFKKPDLSLKTNFPVYLENSDTKINEIIYYAIDKAHQTRFMNSIKYRRAIATEKWQWSEVFKN